MVRMSSSAARRHGLTTVIKCPRCYVVAYPSLDGRRLLSTRLNTARDAQSFADSVRKSGRDAIVRPE